jgi:hypothetical protein
MQYLPMKPGSDVVWPAQTRRVPHFSRSLPEVGIRLVAAPSAHRHYHLGTLPELLIRGARLRIVRNALAYRIRTHAPQPTPFRAAAALGSPACSSLS